MNLNKNEEMIVRRIQIGGYEFMGLDTSVSYRQKQAIWSLQAKGLIKIERNKKDPDIVYLTKTAKFPQ